MTRSAETQAVSVLTCVSIVFQTSRFRASGWTPEWLSSTYELDRNLGYIALQPLGAVAHAFFFGHHVAEDDQALLFTGSDGVLRVLDDFPFPRFADDQHVHFRPGKRAD